MDILSTFSEMLIEISPVILAIASIFALTQIRIAKKAIQVRSKREAVCLAADKCAVVAKEILPLFQSNFLDRPIGKTMKSWELNDPYFTKDSLKEPADGKKWTDKIIAEKWYLDALDFLNQLEALSMYFRNGAADEKVAYPVIGSLYCMWIANFAPLLVMLRSDPVPHTTTGPYQNTVELYKVWSARLVHGELDKEADDLQLRKSAALADQGIEPIGTT